jgi:DNA end-binding protein Ku
MPPRANWKGYLKLSLVTCSVELFPATSDKAPSEWRDQPSAQTKGYEVGKGDYVTVSDGELAAIEIESSHYHRHR